MLVRGFYCSWTKPGSLLSLRSANWLLAVALELMGKWRELDQFFHLTLHHNPNKNIFQNLLSFYVVILEILVFLKGAQIALT